jgi:hypothetical protein
MTGTHHHTQLLVVMGSYFLPGLASNLNPPNAMGNWGYRHKPPHQPGSQLLKSFGVILNSYLSYTLLYALYQQITSTQASK